MHLEVEQKFPAADLATVRRRLLALGAEFAAPIDQADTYFSHPARNFAETDEALRLRRVGEANFITYKGPKLDLQTKTRRELELPLPLGAGEFDRFSELFVVLGFAVVATVRKRRELGWLMHRGMRVEAALDSVEAVGQFVELEIAADDAGLAAAQACIGSLAGQLDLANPERRSYLELLLGKKSQPL
jgi:adenylate cyclase class 2